MKHRFAIFLLAISLLLGGCALTENGGRLALEELSTENDRLAGVFVTRHYLEPAPPSLELNIYGEIVAKDREPEKIYGSFTGYNVDMPVVTFPELEGYGIYSLTAPEDESHEAAGYNSNDFPFTNLHFTVSDQEESMEADLYVSTGSFAQYYFNPVYQQADGQIYLLAGSGMSTDSFVEGQKFGHSICESVSQTENEKSSTRSLRFTVNIIGAGLPEETELLLMDNENRLLERYSEVQLEEIVTAGTSLSLPGETSYLILRQSIAGKDYDSRSLFNRDAESVEYMVPAENEILYFQSLPLVWP